MIRTPFANIVAVAFAQAAASSAFAQAAAPAVATAPAVSTAASAGTAGTASLGSSATQACAQIATASGSLPTGMSATDICSSIINAVQQSTQGSNSSAGLLLNYTEETKDFYAALEKSIRKHGGKERVTVNTALPAIGANKASPIITLATIRAESAPTYTELGLGVWLDRIQAHDGKVCTQSDQHTFAVLAPLIFNFLAKDVLPWALTKYHAAQAYAKASKMDAVISVTQTGAQTGRITQIDFVPRGTCAV